MPYDIVGPLGPKDLGVVTPAEQFAYQKHKDALNFVQQQAQQDALSRAISGKSGWQDDPMGSDAPTPAAAPSYLDKHNAMVDQRQQQTRGLEDATNIANGLDYGSVTYGPNVARMREQANTDVENMKSQQQLDALQRQIVGRAAQANGFGGLDQDLLYSRPSGNGTGFAESQGVDGNTLTGRITRSDSLDGIGRGLPPQDPGMSMNIGASGAGDPGIARTVPPSGTGGNMTDMLDMLSALRGGAVPDRQGMALDRQFKQAQLNALVRQQQIDQQTATMGRNPNARIEDFLAQNPTVSDALNKAGSKFAERDTSTFGLDPTEQDIQNVLAERDNVVSTLMGRGYPRDAAMQQANLLLNRSFGDQGDSLNAGWIAKLRKRAGITQAPEYTSPIPQQPAAPLPDVSGFMPAMGVRLKGGVGPFGNPTLGLR